METDDSLDERKAVEYARNSFTVSVRDLSRWENGIDCINSLLQPGSATLDAMTEEQCLGLKNLKAMIMLSGDGEESDRNHIPQALLESSESSSSDFLLAEYAGYNRRPEFRASWNSMTKVLSAQKCAKTLKKIVGHNMRALESLRKRSIDFRNKDLASIPSHWFDLDHESKVKVRDLLSWDNISRWDFNIFDVDDVLGGENTLVFVAWAIIGSPQSQYAMDMALFDEDEDDSQKIKEVEARKGYDFISTLNVKEKTLINFLHEIEKSYKDVFYHSFVHAADVTQSLHSLLQMGGEQCSQGQLETFSMLIAAVIHDVGHPGLSNLFLINSKSDLALIYNDVSVLENMHLATVFKLVMGDNRDRKIDIFENFRDEELEAARKLIIKAVLTTDMKKHFKKSTTIKGILLVESEGENATESFEVPTDLCFMSEMLSYTLHAADMSNPSRDTEIAVKWTDRLLEELFHQGDMEAEMGLPFSPLCDRNSTRRAKSQIDFIKFIVLPTFKLLAQWIPPITTEVIPKIHKNLEFWQEKDQLKTVEEEI
uniref:Phosphodiesterase n=1 Tax=Pseudo-nitzschia australis TaxID=44445 RepID=A0A6U9XTQ9_9STRA|mmetsp:Transcript_3570/g.7680  ORF Transcript_3570/g.7680 Transcript_3570/m.7680 type:complete len:540 (-) Transcript_3570:354-1973(-)